MSPEDSLPAKMKCLIENLQNGRIEDYAVTAQILLCQERLGVQSIFILGQAVKDEDMIISRSGKEST